MKDEELYRRVMELERKIDDLPTPQSIAAVDAGRAGATEQDWIEVTVGGNTGYIRVYAAK